MRQRGLPSGLVLVLTVAAVASEVRAQSTVRPTGPVGPTAAELEFGTATLGHRRYAVGPLAASAGLSDWVTVGTFTVPWAIAAFDGLSVIPNLFVKVRLGCRGRVSAAVHSSLFYARLNDLDRDGLDARAIIWPTRLVVTTSWRGMMTTAEFSAVLARAVASKLGQQDPEIYGVALASTAYIGAIHVAEWRPNLHWWLRGRAIVAHSPIAIDARIALSDSVRVAIDARANSARLTTVGSAMAGVLWTRRRLVVRAGIGYGHWVLPWIGLPVGRRIPSIEVDAYWRF